MSKIQKRFVHAPNGLADVGDGTYSGFTVCYGRQEAGIILSYSLCHKNDVYSAKMGEKLCSEKWDMATFSVSVLAEYNNREMSLTHIEPSRQIGLVSVGLFKNHISTLGIFTPKLILSMDMYSFTHRQLANWVAKLVKGAIVESKYPT